MGIEELSAWPKESTLSEKLYLGFALLGLAVTQYFNMQFFGSNAEGGIFGLVLAGYVNPGAASIASDAYVAGLASFLFIFVEAKRLKMRFAWLYILGGAVIAYAFTFPLFLMFRERHLRLQASPN